MLRDASETPFGLICSRFRNRSPGCPDFLEKLLDKKKLEAHDFPPKLLGPGGSGTCRCCETRPRRRFAAYLPDSGSDRLDDQNFLKKVSSKKIEGSQFSPQIAGAWGQWNFAVLRDASETPFGCPDFLEKLLVKKKLEAHDFPPKLLGPGGSGTCRCCETRPRRRFAAYLPDSGSDRLDDQNFLKKVSSKKKTRLAIFPPNCWGLGAMELCGAARRVRDAVWPHMQPIQEQVAWLPRLS